MSWISISIRQSPDLLLCIWAAKISMCMLLALGTVVQLLSLHFALLLLVQMQDTRFKVKDRYQLPLLWNDHLQSSLSVSEAYQRVGYLHCPDASMQSAVACSSSVGLHAPLSSFRGSTTCAQSRTSFAGNSSVFVCPKFSFRCRSGNHKVVRPSAKKEEDTRLYQGYNPKKSWACRPSMLFPSSFLLPIDQPCMQWEKSNWILPARML